jgi:hypothetical protein
MRKKAWEDHLAALAPYPEGRYQGKGIVIVAGGRLLESSLVTIKMLRDHGCTLPIEMWYKSDEITSQQLAVVQQMYIITKPFEDLFAADQLEPMDSNVGKRHFQLKSYAVYHSDFEEVLLLDADNTPLKNVEYLFSHPTYEAVGTVLWPGKMPLMHLLSFACGHSCAVFCL